MNKIAAPNSCQTARPARLRRAFTLLELLVSLVLVAIISVSLFATLRIAFRARDSAEHAVEPPRTATLALDTLAADLEAALPVGTEGTNLSSLFFGEDTHDDRGRDGDDMEFYAAVPGAAHISGDGDVKKLDYLVVAATAPDGTADHVLVRRVTSNLLSTDDPSTLYDEEVVCRGVGGFNLRYFDGDTWQDSWDTTELGNVLPLAIEVTLDLDRPLPSGEARTIRYVRVIPIPCASANSTTGTTGTTGLTGSTGVLP